MKKRYYISFVLVLLVTMLILGTTYAYYKTKINGNSKDKSISVLSKYLAVKYSDGTSTMNFDGDYFFPGDSAEKTFSVENTGNDKTTYSIKIDNVINEFERIQDIRYKLYINEEEVSSGAINNSETQYLYYEREIEKGSKDNIKLVVSYSETEESQNVDMNKTLSFRVNIDNKKENKTSGNSVTFIGNGNTLENYRIYGNSVQNGTPTPDNPVEIESVGNKTKNLFDFVQYKEKVLGANKYITFINEGFIINNTSSEKIYTNWYSCKIAVKPNTTYTLSGDIKEKNNSFGTYIDIFEYEQDTNSYLKYTNVPLTSLNKTFTTSGTTNYITIRFAVNTGNYLTAKNIQLEEGTSATEYIPYGKYKISVTISGKNLFDGNAKQGAYIISTGNYGNGSTYICNANKIPVKPNTEYYLSRIGSEQTFIHSILMYDSDNNYLGAATTTTVDSAKKFTTNNDANYISFNIKTIKTSITPSELGQVQLSETLSEYEPYYKQTTNIYLDEPLRKIGDYADYIDFKDQKVVRTIKEKILDPKATYHKNIISTSNAYVVYFEDYKADSLLAMSNRFQNTTTHAVEKGIYAGHNINILTPFSLNITDENLFKEWLTNNYLVVAYILDSEKEQNIYLPKIDTNNGTNILEINTSTNASNIEVSN